jgi:peptidoglycan/xylan/chitin deacetylase (PgdA/CDA1 family)
MKTARLLSLVLVVLSCTSMLPAQQPAQQPQPQRPAQQPALQVAFTFDDLPAHGPLPPGEFRPEPMRSILKTLKAEHMPPVYGFVNGFRTARYPYQAELLKEWIASGNPLGNHTWSHPAFDQTSAKSFIANIAEDEALLSKVGGGAGVSFRSSLQGGGGDDRF